MLNKKYVNLESNSISKPGEIGLENKNSIFDQTNDNPSYDIEKEDSNSAGKRVNHLVSFQNYSCRSSEIETYINDRKVYLVKSEVFQVWHTSNKKCVSYHGIEYASKYNPINDIENIYIKLGPQGKFLEIEGKYEDFNYSEFINKMNYILSKDGVIKSLNNKYGCIKVILGILLFYFVLLLSFFLFYFLVEMISLMYHTFFLFKKGKYFALGLFLIDGGLCMVCLYFYHLVEQKMIFELFKYYQKNRDNLTQEIKLWNEKTFSLINKRATLADNFDYIHIRSSIINK